MKSILSNFSIDEVRIWPWRAILMSDLSKLSEGIIIKHFNSYCQNENLVKHDWKSIMLCVTLIHLHNMRYETWNIKHDMLLTHWGWVMHIYIRKLSIVGSDNGLSPGWRQAITWTNAGILLIGTLGINISEILIKIHTFSLKKTHFKMSSGKWRPSCLSLNVLK